jgi:hypothetical protein
MNFDAKKVSFFHRKGILKWMDQEKTTEEVLYPIHRAG